MHLRPLNIVCPLGLTLDAACAAMRAGISGFAELSYRDRLGEPITGAPVPTLDPEMRLHDRMVALLTLVLDDLTKRRVRVLELPILLCLPLAGRPGIGGWAVDLLQHARESAGFDGRLRIAKTFMSGRTAAFEALRHARVLLDNEETAVLVIGVDSLLSAETLLALDKSFRLKVPANSDGVIPGEAAGAMLIGKVLEDAPLEVKGLGFGEEVSTIADEEPFTGVGMTRAVGEALDDANCALHDVGFTLSDVTGEAYCFEEIVIAHARNSTRTRSERPLWHAAENIGDTGAAAGIVHLSLAGVAFAGGYAPASIAIAQGSCDGSARAAAVVCRGPGRLGR